MLCHVNHQWYRVQEGIAGGFTLKNECDFFFNTNKLWYLYEFLDGKKNEFGQLQFGSNGSDLWEALWRNQTRTNSIFFLSKITALIRSFTVQFLTRLGNWYLRSYAYRIQKWTTLFVFKTDGKISDPAAFCSFRNCDVGSAIKKFSKIFFWGNRFKN